jgi:putative heme-binding domain-containing protein
MEMLVSPNSGSRTGAFKLARKAILPGALLGWSWLCPLVLHASEAWSDDQLSVRNGLAMWFDCSRQNAGRSALLLSPLGSGNAVDYLADGSGHQRHLAQNRRDARPHFRQEFTGAFVSFDGTDDALLGSNWRQSFTNLTLFVVAAPRSNQGGFRAVWAMSQAGANDYTTGLNFDLGPVATPELRFVNAEGSGFGGALQLLDGTPLPFGHWHVFALDVGTGPGAVRLFVDGRLGRSRDREPSVIHADEFVMGARHYSNSGEPPFTQGFFHGEIAEVLLYDRDLSDGERSSVDAYLRKKYGLLLNWRPELQRQAEPLVTVTNPPPVQMLLPGFTVRELPLGLNNINNVRYRADGKLVALGYDGRIYLLTDSDGDGIEDRTDLFWSGDTLRAPIGMAVTPPGYSRGQGVFVAAKGKLSLIVDTNSDDRADKEIIVAEGWKELAHGVDALGVALDRDGNIFFGLGTASFTQPYLVDPATGRAGYNLKNERGTILKVSSDFRKREIVCTGIRFSVALAFNREGDLFCTDQEGATWLPNGNPLDELLHIQSGRHYGFPPRHPKYLPDVIDEPSVFDYGPQHQSTCGLNFDEAVNGGSVFGPAWWGGDALVCGYSRGKVWRTKLVKTAAGYVAENQLIASLPVLTVDACVSPGGDLVVSTHGGEPDWGSGPNGQGRLFKIRYADKPAQPVAAWSAGPAEFEIAFDRPLDPEDLKNLAQRVHITEGKYVSAGDRFEIKRPGYAAVYSQLNEPRYPIAVQSADFTPDFRALVLRTQPAEAAFNYAVTLERFERSERAQQGLPQFPDVDLVMNLNGLQARWDKVERGPADSNQAPAMEIWLPHFDLDVARQLTQGSAPHESFWPRLTERGMLTLRGQLNLWEMLHPAIQPGSRLDYERDVEQVTVVFSADRAFRLKSRGGTIESKADDDQNQRALIEVKAERDHWLPVELFLSTGPAAPRVTATWFTADDPRPRAFPLRRFFVPWATPNLESPPTNREPARPELAGGNWLRGQHIFFGDTASCYKCHLIRGAGNRVGPDLSNLIQRDYASVLKDIVQPNAALNPDHLAYHIRLQNGDEVTGVIQTESRDNLRIADATGHSLVLARENISSIRPSAVSLMPEGLDKALGPGQLKDLLTFLLTLPLEPAPLEARGEPPPRSQMETEAALLTTRTSDRSDATPFHIVLCAGPKDHGPGEHDYPLWQSRWKKLLSLADNVRVSTAWEWPTPEQWREANVLVFYSDNPGWSSSRADQLDAFLARGGGAVFIHFAVDGHQDVEALARCIGLAWRGGASKFRHGSLDLVLEESPVTTGLDRVKLVDESYWALVGNLSRDEIVGSSLEEGQSRPLMWTRTRNGGRVFVSIPGHYTWTFDDPIFRLLLLRGICWAGRQPVDRLSELASVGARIQTLETANREPNQ